MHRSEGDQFLFSGVLSHTAKFERSETGRPIVAPSDPGRHCGDRSSGALDRFDIQLFLN